MTSTSISARCMSALENGSSSQSSISARGGGARRRRRARRPAARRARRRRCARSTSVVSASAGGPNGDLLAVQADDAVPAPRLLDVVRGDEQDAALVAQLAEQRLDARAARPRRRRERLVEQQHRRVLQQRAGDQHALALAAGERRRSGGGRGRRGRRARAPRRAASRSARATRRQAGVRRVRAHQHDVERADREVEPRAIGLRHVGRQRPRARPSRAAPGSSPSSARNSVVLPPPLGPSTAAIVPGVERERDAARATSLPARVAAGEVTRRARAAHARAPPIDDREMPPPSTAIAGPGPTLSS